jgi:hypothetical protein
MKSIQRIAKPVSLCLAVMMFLIFVPVHAVLAALIPTDAVAQSQSGQTARHAINTLIDREDVQKALIDQGLDPQEARDRVAALSDEEAIKLAEMFEELPAGGGVIGVLVALILIVFLVLLITDLTGMTDVFPWVK